MCIARITALSQEKVELKAELAMAQSDLERERAENQPLRDELREATMEVALLSEELMTECDNGIGLSNDIHTSKARIEELESQLSESSEEEKTLRGSVEHLMESLRMAGEIESSLSAEIEDAHA